MWVDVTAWIPRLVALDIDGTLLDPATQRIAPAVRDVVHRAADAGSRVVIATGRSVLGTLPVAEELGLTSGYLLCSNGAVMVDAATGDVESVETFDPAPVVADLTERLPGARFAAERIGIGNLVTAEFSAGLLQGPQQIVPLPDLVAAPIPRLIANWSDHTPGELTERMAGVRLPGSTCTLDHYEPWVTVVGAGITKASALEKLRVGFGIAPQDTFAAGDGDNDIPMLRWAAHGVAMGQAPMAVHAAADEVVTPVTANGAAEALSRWFS